MFYYSFYKLFYDVPYPFNIIMHIVLVKMLFIWRHIWVSLKRNLAKENMSYLIDDFHFILILIIMIILNVR